MTFQKHLLRSDSLYQYMISCSLRESKIQAELREKTIAEVSNPEKMTSPDQAQFLNFLIKLISARKIIELGVYTGYGSLAMALALPDDGILIGCEIDERFPLVGEPFWQRAGVANKIILEIAPALVTLETLLNNNEKESFDFIFIDADKVNNPAYYEYALLLIRKGGLIVVDNVLSFGKALVSEGATKSAKVVQELNLHIQQDPRVEVTLVPVGGGSMLVQKK